VDEAARAVARDLRLGLPKGSELLGPAPMFRVRNRHRRRVLIKAEDRAGMIDAMRDVVERKVGDRSLKDVAIGVDIDPQ
jgi:primosomal protein N' (replication factor Y)